LKNITDFISIRLTLYDDETVNRGNGGVATGYTLRPGAKIRCARGQKYL